jgi:hypothetical protein
MMKNQSSFTKVEVHMTTPFKKKNYTGKVISSFRYLVAAKLSKWSIHCEKN